jgi:hypothetical protein
MPHRISFRLASPAPINSLIFSWFPPFLALTHIRHLSQLRFDTGFRPFLPNRLYKSTYFLIIRSMVLIDSKEKSFWFRVTCIENFIRIPMARQLSGLGQKCRIIGDPDQFMKILFPWSTCLVFNLTIHKILFIGPITQPSLSLPKYDHEFPNSQLFHIISHYSPLDAYAHCLVLHDCKWQLYLLFNDDSSSVIQQGVNNGWIRRHFLLRKEFQFWNFRTTDLGDWYSQSWALSFSLSCEWHESNILDAPW